MASMVSVAPFLRIMSICSAESSKRFVDKFSPVSEASGRPKFGARRSFDIIGTNGSRGTVLAALWERAIDAFIAWAILFIASSRLR